MSARRLALAALASLLVHLAAAAWLAGRAPVQLPAGPAIGLALGDAPAATPDAAYPSTTAVPTSPEREGAPASAASPPVRTSGGGGRDRYLARVRAQLEFHKQAADLPAEGHGTVLLRFTVRAGGEVEAPAIARSSGSAALDRAAMALLQRAAPLPPPPGAALVLTVPIEFE